MSDTIVVLGGDGYLGWPLAVTLAAQRPRARVVVVDNLARRRAVAATGSDSITPIRDPARRLDAYAAFAGRRNLEFEALDVATPALDALIDRLRPAVVYHLAQQASAPFSMASVEQAVHTLTNNEVGNLRLLWALRDRVPQAHLIKLGSFGEYAHCGLEIAEGYFLPAHAGATANRPVPFPREADDIYHVSKINDTNYCALACRNWGLRVTDVMQSTAFGATTRETADAPELATRLDYDAVFGTVVNRFVAQAVTGHPLTIYGSGHQRTGLMALDDAVGSLARLADRPPERGEHRVINHVTERTLSINEIAAAVQALAADRGVDVTLSREHDPRGEAPEVKPAHTIRADFVDANVTATPFEAVLADLFDTVSRHRDRVRPAAFPPAIPWRPADPHARTVHP
ncbi:MAG: NAD-dependent epimerase/dehydratase family protein [Myxococcales bacterium]|nr:NAD-dependent epimerase/dehydratase family protein [Myxococcales bacterium]